MPEPMFNANPTSPPQKLEIEMLWTERTYKCWQAGSIFHRPPQLLLSLPQCAAWVETANQALQRTAPAVTLAAPPPALRALPSRQPPPSLSLGSLIWLCLSTFGKALSPTFFLVVFMAN